MSRDAWLVLAIVALAGLFALCVVLLFAGAARWSRPVRQEYLEVIEFDAEPTEPMVKAQRQPRLVRPFIQPDPEETKPLLVWERPQLPADYKSNNHWDDDPTRVET